MSFLHPVSKTSSMRADEIRSAFHSLTQDFLKRQQKQQHHHQQVYNPPTPPLTPETATQQIPQLMLSSAVSLRSSAHDLSAFEPRGEPTSVISCYEKTDGRSLSYSTPNTLQRMTLSTDLCLCCPPKSYSTNPHLYSRPAYDTINRENNPQNMDEMSKSMFRESEKIHRPIPTNPTVSFSNLQSDKAMIGIPSPNLKRRFESMTPSAPIDPTAETPMKKMKLSNETMACQVHGILSLPGSREPRYNISKSELERRVNEPECLTKVDMISYVRLAKNSARTLLEKNNIKTNQHNKRSEHTVLSKMCESECQVLSQGLREINFRYFPGMWFAKKSVEEISTNNLSSRQQREALKERLKEDGITKCVLMDIYFGLERRHHDEEMKNFNLMSHTFGVPNLMNHIFFLYRYLEEEERILKQIFAHHT